MSFETKPVDLVEVNLTPEYQEKKDFLLSQENFELLMRAQRDIEAITELRPTFKKLINLLVTEKAIDHLKQQVIEQLS